MDDNKWKVVSYGSNSSLGSLGSNSNHNSNFSNNLNLGSNSTGEAPSQNFNKFYWKNFYPNKQPTITTTEQISPDTLINLPVNVKPTEPINNVDNTYQNNYRRPCYKPCDKFNLEGYCRWGDRCKYSHKDLTQQEWEMFYPTVPFSIKISNHDKRIYDSKYRELEGRLKVLEYKMKCMDTHYETKINQLEFELNSLKKSKIHID